MAFRDHCYRSDKKITEEGIYSVNTLETQATETSEKGHTQWRQQEEGGCWHCGKAGHYARKCIFNRERFRIPPPLKRYNNYNNSQTREPPQRLSPQGPYPGQDNRLTGNQYERQKYPEQDGMNSNTRQNGLKIFWNNNKEQGGSGNNDKEHGKNINTLNEVVGDNKKERSTLTKIKIK